VERQATPQLRGKQPSKGLKMLQTTSKWFWRAVEAMAKITVCLESELKLIVKQYDVSNSIYQKGLSDLAGLYNERIILRKFF
jgi:hypothetical protein